MPASFTLTVDLSAPAVTWGAVTGTTAGELLRVAYTVDEPALVAADLELADGRHLSFTIHESWIEVLLPPDTPTGVGRVRATTEDDVENEAVFNLVLHLQGAVTGLPGPTATGGGPIASTPGPDVGAPRLVELGRSSARARVRHDTTAVLAYAVQGRARSSSTTGAVATGRARAVLRRAGRTSVTLAPVRVGGSVLTRQRRAVRRDGRELEEALLLELVG